MEGSQETVLTDLLLSPGAREILPEMRIKEQCDQLRTAVTIATSTKRAERESEPTQQKAGDAAHFS